MAAPPRDCPALRAVAALGEGTAIGAVCRWQQQASAAPPSTQGDLDVVAHLARATLQYRPAKPRHFLCTLLHAEDAGSTGEDPALRLALEQRIPGDSRFSVLRFAHGGCSCEYYARVDRSDRYDRSDPLSAVLDQSTIPQTIWPAAFPFAEWIAVAEGAESLRGRSVLELGSGVGLCGIAAAAHAARVVLSDLDPVSLALCRCSRRLAANAAAAQRAGLEAVQLRWACPRGAERAVAANGGQLFDVVLGADVFYIAASLRAGLVTADHVLAPGGLFVCASAVRSDRTEDDLDSVPAEAGWVLDGGCAELRPEGEHDGQLRKHKGAGGVRIYRWRRGSAGALPGADGGAGKPWWARPDPSRLRIPDPRGGGGRSG
eukprot:TRINITY_DN17100_c0_g1_i1.p1 TRINITY_DN17100_c0_g1~~TRINITY_DN17100_c0_g1_i1.p1  ORF type:complete len:374 (+),score=92.04 TRINITY_DN17100_c0_g1_i1:68-1189(+)